MTRLCLLNRRMIGAFHRLYAYQAFCFLSIPDQDMHSVRDRSECSQEPGMRLRHDGMFFLSCSVISRMYHTPANLSIQLRSCNMHHSYRTGFHPLQSPHSSESGRHQSTGALPCRKCKTASPEPESGHDIHILLRLRRPVRKEIRLP